jgi:hypothetical protein
LNWPRRRDFAGVESLNPVIAAQLHQLVSIVQGQIVSSAKDAALSSGIHESPAQPSVLRSFI